MKAKFFFVILISLLGFVQVKADTIYYQLPGNAQLCQDPLAMDTFVFYKPLGFGSTMWYINFVLVGSGDSIIFIPSTSGDHVISSTWNSNVEQFMLSIYTQIPAPANFSLLGGGGVINATNDTIWMCGGSVTVSSNTIGGEATSYHWRGPGGFLNSSNDPITISDPGMYIFERPNPCGITRDTFYLVSLPTTLPVFSDTVFCNTPVELLLDAGPGFTYQWSTTETEQTIFVTSPGTYSVSVSNFCVSGSVSMTVEHQSFPLPDLSAFSSGITGTLCQDEIATLIAYTGYTYDHYQWYKGPTLIPISNQPTLSVDYALGHGYYAVEVSQGNCTAFSDVVVSFYGDPQTTFLCVATFDPLVGKNKVVFEHMPTLEVQDYVLCLRQGANWIGIDTIPPSSPEQVLYDHLTDPNQQSRTYTVFARHQCGHLSPLSDWHKTIRIGIFQDIYGDYVLQVMDDYLTLSGYAPSSYTIWIDSLNNGNFVDIGILDGGNMSFTISAPVNGAAYYASVNLPWNCDSKTNAVAFSNKRVFDITSIPHVSKSLISLYPNPSTGLFSVKGENISLVEVKDVRGSLLLQTTETQNIDLSVYSSGIYIITVNTEQGSTNHSLILE